MSLVELEGSELQPQSLAWSSLCSCGGVFSWPEHMSVAPGCFSPFMQCEVSVPKVGWNFSDTPCLSLGAGKLVLKAILCSQNMQGDGVETLRWVAEMKRLYTFCYMQRCV